MIHARFYRRSIPLLLALAVVSTLYACSSMPAADSPADVRLGIEPAAVSAGDSITLSLENRSTGTIGYNLCTSSLERRVGGDWQAVSSDRVCTMELRTLLPGQTASFTLALPAALSPGEYRAVTGVERMDAGERVGVSSEPFTVQPARTPTD